MHLVVDPDSALVTVGVLPVVQVVDVGALDVSENVDLVEDIRVGSAAGGGVIATHTAVEAQNVSLQTTTELWEP